MTHHSHGTPTSRWFSAFDRVALAGADIPPTPFAGPRGVTDLPSLRAAAVGAYDYSGWTSPPPERGAAADVVLDEFARDVAPYPFGNGHPRFYGWVNSPPAVIGIFGAALAAAMNPSVAGGNHAAARLCTVNVLAQARSFLGRLDRVRRVCQLLGFVNAVAGFTDHPAVLNGAADRFVDVFGDTTGKHARIAVGAASLPSNVSVELATVLEVHTGAPTPAGG